MKYCEDQNVVWYNLQIMYPWNPNGKLNWFVLYLMDKEILLENMTKLDENCSASHIRISIKQ